ncbi:MAG: protein translocase subunit SecDF [Bacteroidales bacterium]|nr:protein translocase subunit SecDF [Bacteroidales bacterium]
MQNKGFIKVFAALLMLVCLFYLSFTFVSRHLTQQAEDFAQGDDVKFSSYMDSISSEKVFLGYTFKECRELELNLGLDLKGGMNVVLEISIPDVIKSLSNNNPDENFNKALKTAKELQVTSQKDVITLFVEEYKKLDPGARLAAIFSTYELKEKITPQSTDAEVIAVLRTEVKDAIANSFNVLRTRIDRFGVVQPNIQQLENNDGRILVELPGVKEPERVRKLLQGTANLEFWETYELSEVYPFLVSANREIARLKATSGSSDSSAVKVADSTAIASADTTANSSDSLLNLVQAGPKENADSMNQQANNEKAYPLFSVLQLNVTSQGAAAPGAVVGFAHAKDTVKVNNYLNMKSVKELLPRNLSLKWAVKAMDDKGLFYELYAIKVASRNGRPSLDGSVVTDANADFGQHSATAKVNMSMNAEGAKAWARLTKENTGKCIAIVLDNMVYSAPRVNGEIAGGNSEITGNFTPEEAKDLANVLKSGKMAAPARIIQEAVVGPSLGEASINAGIWSFVIALIVLASYMVMMYGWRAGFVANSALILNLFFTIGILASFHAVLTLSGIAGIVLSLGMAVDANVLIYERTKEELRAGKTVKKAISEGYSNAFSAIFDSNLTSIITGVILFYFGTGPIRGFATTLIIGIVCSFFTAVFLTRIVYEYFLEKGKFSDLTFTTSVSKNLLVQPKVPFMELRKKVLLGVAAFVVVLAAAFVFMGLNNGIDFTGGRNYIVKYDQTINTKTLEESLQPIFYADGKEQSAINVITIGSDNQVRISTNYRIKDQSEDVDGIIEGFLYQGSKKFISSDLTQEQFVSNNIVSSQKVGPAIAEDMKTGAIWATIFSLLAISLYILLRFRDISFSVGTMIALTCDVLVILGLYSLLWKIMPFSMEVDQTFIGAILTVIGYSVNDKVVIFDRVREFLHLYPSRDRKQLFDDSLNTTLSRTLNTSFTTLIVLIFIFALGGDAIRSLCFALIIGVLFGTFSSIFIAAPIAFDMQKKQLQKKAAALSARK